MNCQEAREFLEEYRRAELEPGALGPVEAHVSQCAACQALLAETEALVARVRTLPRTPAPPALRRWVRRLPARRPGSLTWLGRPWVAAAVAAAAVALLLSPWLRIPPERGADRLEVLLESGVAEHRRILLQVQALTEAVGDPAQVFDRVRSLTEIQLAPVFAGAGELRLLAARPTLLANRKTAAATLRYPTSPVTTYFVLPGKDLPMPSERRVQIDQYKPYMRQISEFNVIYWKQGDLAYIMVSGLDEAGCRQLFLKMRRAL